MLCNQESVLYGGIVADLTIESQNKLDSSKIIWIASVRSDGRPHLTPVWFVYYSQKVYLCIDPGSVKASNLRQNDQVVLALEDGSKPVICEGRAAPVVSSWPAAVIAGFKDKY